MYGVWNRIEISETEIAEGRLTREPPRLKLKLKGKLQPLFFVVGSLMAISLFNCVLEKLWRLRISLISYIYFLL